jgi:hypothetical protein
LCLGFETILSKNYQRQKPPVNLISKNAKNPGGNPRTFYLTLTLTKKLIFINSTPFSRFSHFSPKFPQKSKNFEK